MDDLEIKPAAVKPAPNVHHKKLIVQAKRLTFLEGLLKFFLYAVIPLGIAVAIYCYFMGPVAPWEVEPISSWVAQMQGKEADPLPAKVENISEPENGVPANPAPKIIPDTSEQYNKLTSRLSDLNLQLQESLAERVKAERKLKSAQSFLPIADTRIDKAVAEWNTANAAYQNRFNGPARGGSAALVRLQQDIDRAARHKIEADAYYDEKKAAVGDAEKTLKELNIQLEKYKAEQSELSRQIKEISK
jgi:hypothetical protein